MAFSNKEQQIIDWGTTNGKTGTEIRAEIFKFRNTGKTASERGELAPVVERDPVLIERQIEISPRPEVISRIAGEAKVAKEEAERIASPLGQAKEIGKEFGEIFGITPTARRIAASLAPTFVPTQELPSVVEELVGGVETPQPSRLKEFGQIALDLPLITLGLSKTISKFLAEKGAKIAPEALRNIISKRLIDFVPDVLKKEIPTPDIKLPTEVSQKVISIATKPFEFVVSRVPKLLGIVTGESTDVVKAALKDPKGADKAIRAGDEALRNVVRDAGEKATELKFGFINGHKESLAKLSQSLSKDLRYDQTQIVKQFEDLLKTNNIKIIDGKLDFSTSLAQANAGEVTKIRQAWGAVNSWEDFSFEGTNNLKRLVQLLARFSDDAGQPAKSPILGKAQRGINDLIKAGLEKDQKTALEAINKNFGDNIDLFEDMEDAFNKGDPFTRIAGIFGQNKDKLRQIVGFFEQKTGEDVLSTVAGRELAKERKAAFGFLNPRSWIDLIFPPELQAKLVTKVGKRFPKLTETKIK